MDKSKKSRKGKKSWRKNIDMESVQEELIQRNQAKAEKSQLASLQKKIAKEEPSSLFTIDSAVPRRRREPLQAGRFKKKEKEEVLLKADRLLVRRLARQEKKEQP